jgi:arabinan endo-1,5-alpha-L-arabinosidase
MTETPLKRVSIHDPAIIEANGKYYIFGTNRQFAVSDDLIHWNTLENNITRDVTSVLGDIWNEWPNQPSNPKIEGNTWAPDVIYNPAMGKYCMYMSVNGDRYRSVIVLLVADDLSGDWNYVGPVVYSGFDATNVERTDVPEVLGQKHLSEEDLARYHSLEDTRINAIDASMSYDDNGDLWMTFGSWFGGIWMIKLDPQTGLRDYSASYPTVADKSDAYYGIKLAGGHWASGEGSYLVHTNGYWYMFLAYGELGQRGGYQIRLFRSSAITGPYYDQAGNPAIFTDNSGRNWTGTTGLRLTSSYAWAASGTSDLSSTDYAKLQHIEVSQGHNSVLGPVKSQDDALYIVYHTRFADLEPETRYSYGRDHFEVRLHELLPTQDGWLVMAPFEYQGVRAAAAEEAAGAKHPTDFSGTYEVITHEPQSFFDSSLDKGHRLHGINLPQLLTFTETGAIVRTSQEDASDIDTAASVGTWSCLPNTTAHGTQMIMTLDGVEYSGVFSILPNETDGTPTATFSVAGNNICLWGAHLRR